jgi:hypothetical protein
MFSISHHFFDTSAVVTTLVLAEHHGCHQLKEAILKSHKELMVDDDFRYLASTCPSLPLLRNVDAGRGGAVSFLDE